MSMWKPFYFVFADINFEHLYQLAVENKGYGGKETFYPIAINFELTN